MPEEIKNHINDHVMKATSAANHATENYVREIANNVRRIEEQIPEQIEQAVNKYVNGKIDRLHEKFDIRDKLQDEAHARMDVELAEIKKDVGTIHDINDSLKVFQVLGKMVKGTASVVGALAVISAAFWAFVKFVILNASIK